jgi:hypothetical protein
MMKETVGVVSSLITDHGKIIRDLTNDEGNSSCCVILYNRPSENVDPS